jgi:hypothetical protein
MGDVRYPEGIMIMGRRGKGVKGNRRAEFAFQRALKRGGGRYGRGGREITRSPFGE